jgi:multidrug efflux system outer membrane protein
MFPTLDFPKKTGVALAIALALTGCAVSNAPTQTELAEQAFTNVTQPANWHFGKTPGDFDAEALGFSLPPELVALIKEAQEHNPDLRIAASRVAQAQAALTAAGASLLPMIGIGGQYGASPMPTSSLSVDGLALVATWELDLWGKTRSGEAAAQANTLAAELDTLYARQSLAAGVVKAWLAAVEAQRQIALSLSLQNYAEQQLALIQIGQKVGRNSQQDILLNQIAVKTYSNQILQSEQAANSAQRALELLLGRYPSAEIAVASTLPAVPTPIPAGLPSDLVERRPDVRAAENRFRAAFYQVEVAKKAKLPSISLTGGVALLDNELLELQDSLDNPVWGLTGTLLAPLFTNGALDAQIEIKTQQQKESTVLYAKTMLDALNEVEGGLYNEQKLSDRYALVQAQVADQQRIVDLERIQVKVGNSNQYLLYQQQMSLASNQLALLRLHNERLIQRVNLHLALGGMYPM